MKEYDENKIRDHYRELTEYLIAKELTITTMESATSGQIASLITDTEGASAIFKGAFITYSNEAKILQGVPAEIIDQYSVYSKETAEAMAKAAFQSYKADIAIGVTGTMGNIDPDNPTSSIPGKVYFSVYLSGEVNSYEIEISPQPSRLMYKLGVAEEIYEVLNKKLQEN